MKIIVTFGSMHLQWLCHILNPMNVALIVEGENEAIQYVGDNEVLYPFIEEVYIENISDKKA